MFTRLALALWLSPLTVHAQQMISFQDGTYHCEVEGRPTQVDFKVRDDQLLVSGLNLGLVNSLTCTNQTLTKTKDGAIYTYRSSCDGNEISREISLERPDSLEHFRMAAHVQKVATDEIHVQVKIQFSGSSDQNVSTICRR